jgi:nitrous oxidase accessory protein
LIENNVINNASFAIHFSNSTRSIVRNNTIRGTNKSEHSSGNGIHMWKCDGMLVENNFIQGHRDGIYFEFVTGSTIRKNTSERNIRYGLHFMFSHNDHYLDNIFRNNGAGVAVMYSKSVTMENNLFDKNWGASAYGVLLKDISNSFIRNNKFIQNTVAIHMEGSSRIEIADNIFKANGWAIKVQASCDDNSFHHNNFFSNSFDVATNGTVSLNKFYNNYWDKYEGYDMNKDGIGELPYHPVSMYAMVVEQNPTTLLLMRSFIVSLLDKAEKAIPSLTPESLVDEKPLLKPNKL